MAAQVSPSNDSKQYDPADKNHDGKVSDDEADAHFHDVADKIAHAQAPGSNTAPNAPADGGGKG